MTTILSFAKEIMFVVQQIFLLGIYNDLNLKRIREIWHLLIKTDLASPHFPKPLSRWYLVTYNRLFYLSIKFVIKNYTLTFEIK